MRALLARSLILLAVIGLVFTPPILTGYSELKRADSKMDVGNVFIGCFETFKARRQRLTANKIPVFRDFYFSFANLARCSFLPTGARPPLIHPSSTEVGWAPPPEVDVATRPRS